MSKIFQRLPFIVVAFNTPDNCETQAAFASLSLANQWAKAAAILEGPLWEYRVYNRDNGKHYTTYRADGSILTPSGIAL